MTLVEALTIKSNKILLKRANIMRRYIMKLKDHRLVIFNL